MMNKERKFHYFYKIINNINNHFYYGVHNTDNINDGYMGSGKRLHFAYQKYGIENFSKEILKYFKTSKEAFEYEAEFVNEELVKDDNCYNVQEGGKGLHSINTIMVKNIYTGETFRCYKNDPRLKTGELVGISKGMLVAKDKSNKKYYISVNDERYLSGELVSVLKGKKPNHICDNSGKVIVKDINYNYYQVSINDPRYISGELIMINKNRKSVYDKDGNHYFVEPNDPRLLSGELFIKEKPKHEYKGHYLQLHKKFIEINHQQGEKNSQFGTCWIHNNKENKKIKKEELENYINLGWIKGRKMKF